MGPGRSQSAVIPLSPHPSQTKTPWGASNGPLDHERPNPLEFNQGRHPGSQIWIRMGPDWPLARPLPQGAEPPGPWGRSDRAHGDPADGPAQQAAAAAADSGSPGLECCRQRWAGRPIACGSWGRALPRCPAASLFCCAVVLLPRAGRRRPGQGRPQGLEPSSTGGQGQGKVGAPGQASSPSRSSERP